MKISDFSNRTFPFKVKMGLLKVHLEKMAQILFRKNWFAANICSCFLAFFNFFVVNAKIRFNQVDIPGLVNFDNNSFFGTNLN